MSFTNALWMLLHSLVDQSELLPKESSESGVQGLTIYHVKSHLQVQRVKREMLETCFHDLKTPLGCKKVADGGTKATSRTTRGSKAAAAIRIEDQGKYLKKIIEEQQQLTGVLVETPGPAGVSCPDSNEKTDPSTRPNL